MNRTLFPHQEKSIELLKQSLRSGKIKHPPYDLVKYLFDYDPHGGLLTRRVRVANRVNVGDAVGYGEKHLQVCVCGKLFQVHCIIWCWMTGWWPRVEIDHRDTNGLNNKWKNLREATKKQNGANRGANKNNLLGIKGVHRTKGGKFIAQITVDGRNIYLGLYDSPGKAASAYATAGIEHHGEFARAS